MSVKNCADIVEELVAKRRAEYDEACQRKAREREQEETLTP